MACGGGYAMFHHGRRAGYRSPCNDERSPLLRGALLPGPVFQEGRGHPGVGELVFGRGHFVPRAALDQLLDHLGGVLGDAETLFIVLCMGWSGGHGDTSRLSLLPTWPDSRGLEITAELPYGFQEFG